MSEPMAVEVVSPERVLYSGEATMVITRTFGGGEIAFQANHAPFLGALSENHTRVFQVDGTVRDIAVHGGFVEVERQQGVDPVRRRRARRRDRHRARQGRQGTGRGRRSTTRTTPR